MSAAHIAFYATSATVIPVFLIAYLVRTRTVIGKFFRWMMLRAISRGTTKGVLSPSVMIGLMFGQFALLFLSALPAIGEVASLHALATDRAGSATEVLVIIGLAVSGGAVLAPVLYTALGLDALAPAYWAFWQIDSLRRERASGRLSREDFRKQRDELTDRAGLPRIDRVV